MAADPLTIQLPASQPVSPLGSPTDRTAPLELPPSPVKATNSEDVICKVCRGGIEEGDLFSPCKCKGSIQHVHQDCLFQWLKSRKGKEQCEVCHTDYRFLKRYADHVPRHLPFFLLLKRIFLSCAWLVLSILRVALVLFCWIALLPWMTYWTLQFILFSGLAISGGLTAFAQEPQIANLTANATLAAAEVPNVTTIALDDPWKRAIYQAAVSPPVNGSAAWKYLEEGLKNISNNPISNAAIMAKWNINPPMTVEQLIERIYWKSSFNRWLRAKEIGMAMAKDTFSGQIVTCFVVVAFISIFLLREWIGQQGVDDDDRPAQPIVPPFPPLPPGTNPEQMEEEKESIWQLIQDRTDSNMSRETFDRLFDAWVAAARRGEGDDNLGIEDTARRFQHAADNELEAEDSVSEESEDEQEQKPDPAPAEPWLKRDLKPLPRRAHGKTYPAPDLSFSSGQTSPTRRRRSGKGKAKAIPPQPVASGSNVKLEDAEKVPLPASDEDEDVGAEGSEYMQTESKRRPFQQAAKDEEPEWAQPTEPDPVQDRLNGRTYDELMADRASAVADQALAAIEAHLSGRPIPAYVAAAHALPSSPTESHASRASNDVEDLAIPELKLIDTDSEPDLEPEAVANNQEALADLPAGDPFAEPEDDIVVLGGANEDEMPAIPPELEGDEMGLDDIEGALEAIGLRGSVLILFQTVALMDLLISVTLAVLVWVPLIIGRIAILANLPYHVCVGPVKLARFITDPFVDFCSYLISFVVSTQKSLPVTSESSTNSTIVDTPAGPAKDLNPLQRAITEYVLPPIKQQITNSRSEWHRLGTADTTYDKIGCIMVGYTVALIIATAWYAREKNADKPVSRAFRRVLRQQGILVKVAMFVLIELMMFPIFCGFAINLATLPLFPGASIESRLLYHQRAPYSALFLTWTLGTVFMFLVAQCISHLRSYLRKGGLFFIRDPRDPDASPITEMVNTSIPKQIVKLSKSVVLYGSLNAVFAMWAYGGIATRTGILPLRWDQSATASAIPIDLIAAYLFIPWSCGFIEPAIGDAPRKAFVRVVAFCAHQFRLTSYLLGVRIPSEEGTYSRQTWVALLQLKKTLPARLHCANKTAGPSSPTSARPEVVWQPSGTLARVPAVDTVKLAPGRPSTIAVDANRVPTSELGAATMKAQDELGGGSTDWQFVYLPPRFRLRLMACLYSLWIAVTAGCVTIAVLPLLFGRLLMPLLLDQPVHDGYTFLLGAYTFYPLLWACCHFYAWAVPKTPTRGRFRRRGKAFKVLGLSRFQQAKLYAKRGWMWFSLVSRVLIEGCVVLPLLVGLTTRLYTASIWQPVFGRDSDSDTIWLPMAWAYGVVECSIAYAILQFMPGPHGDLGLLASLLNYFEFVDPEPLLPVPPRTTLQQLRATERKVLRPMCRRFMLALIAPFAVTRLLLLGASHAAPHAVHQLIRLDLVCLCFMLYDGRKSIKKLLTRGYSKWMSNVRDAEFMVERRLLNFDDPRKDGDSV